MASWLRPYRLPASTAVPADLPLLVCFPHAGGAPSWYRPLALSLAYRLRMVAVLYPGRQDRHADPHPRTIQGLAEGVAAELGGRPCAFFGHSMGSVVAYETARLLGAHGPRHLYVSGRRSPAAPYTGPDEDLHTRDDAGLVAHIARLGGTDPALLADPEVMAVVLPPARADYAAIETYQHVPGPELDCPLTVLTGADDPQVTPAEAERWADHTSGPFEVRVFPGGHFYLADQWPAVAAAIR